MLLYVGISLFVQGRTEGHSSASHWFDEVVRIEIERFRTMAEANLAEIAAIKVEKPKYNKYLVRGYQGRVLMSKRHQTLEATKPWEKLGISRRTFFRRRFDPRYSTVVRSR